MGEDAGLRTPGGCWLAGGGRGFSLVLGSGSFSVVWCAACGFGGGVVLRLFLSAAARRGAGGTGLFSASLARQRGAFRWWEATESAFARFKRAGRWVVRAIMAARAVQLCEYRATTTPTTGWTGLFRFPLARPLWVFRVAINNPQTRWRRCNFLPPQAA